jgi:predicted porin
MQKKIIALAVAGLVSGAAFAQSNVTVYGVVDVGFVNSSGDRPGTAKASANYSGIDSGLKDGSRIGFKGEEGLGNGLKAIFTLEYYIAPDENTALGAAPETTGAGGSGSVSRQSFVGLSHAKLGTFTLGRQYSAGFWSAVRTDAFSGFSFGSQATMNATGKNSIIAGNTARLNNSAVYVSPNWSGFTVVGGYSYGEGGGTTANGISQGNAGVITAGLNYANGPMNIDLVYQSRQGLTTALVSADTTAGLTAVAASGASQDSVNEWHIGGSYDFKVVKLFASYQDQNDNNDGGTAATRNSLVEASNRVWSVGATMPVFTNGKVLLSYSDLSWDRKNAGGSDSWSLGYVHALSKRTSLYTAYNHTDNDKSALLGGGVVGNTKFRGESNDTIVAGISHSF